MDTKVIPKNKAIKCNILKKEYMIISNILIKLQNVINNNEYILHRRVAAHNYYNQTHRKFYLS